MHHTHLGVLVGGKHGDFKQPEVVLAERVARAGGKAGFFAERAFEGRAVVGLPEGDAQPEAVRAAVAPFHGESSAQHVSEAAGEGARLEFRVLNVVEVDEADGSA